MNKRNLKTVFLDTVPVMTGYLFLGISFGILLGQTGYGFLWAVAMAVFMYAGSAQFLAVGLLASHASILSSAVAIFLLNARHIFYGISLIDTYKGTGKKKPYLIFALTDETYSLVTQNQPPEGMSRHSYCFWVSLFDHLYWICGCTVGGILGAALPFDLTGVEFVLTALFVMIFVEQWLSTKNHRPALIGVGVTGLSLLIFGKQLFLVPALVVICLLLTLTQKTGRRAQDA